MQEHGINSVMSAPQGIAEAAGQASIGSQAQAPAVSSMKSAQPALLLGWGDVVGSIRWQQKQEGHYQRWVSRKQ